MPSRMNYSVGLTDIGDIRTGKAPQGGLTTLLNKRFQKKLSRGDKKTLDILWNLTESNPKTKEVVAASFYKLTRPADLEMGKMLSAVGKSLGRAPGSLPGGVTQTKSRQVRVPGFSAVKTPPWAALSDDYLSNLGLVSIVTKKGHRTVTPLPGLGSKKFWYERNRPGSYAESLLGASGPDMASQASQYFKSLAKQMLIERKSYFKTRTVSDSSAGKDNRFTIYDPARSGRHTFKGKNRTGEYSVYGVTGQMVYPRRLVNRGAGEKHLDEAFTLTLIRSLASGNHSAMSEWASGKEIVGLYAAGPKTNWRSRLLMNEYQRPWISKFFSTHGGRKFVNKLRYNYAKQVGAKPLRQANADARASRSGG